MESELARCPVCGAKILPSVVPMYDDGSAASTASCFNRKCLYRVRREDHNTLARRAEIGRLVEQLTDACRVVPMVGKGEDLLTELRARVKELTDGD